MLYFEIRHGSWTVWPGPWLGPDVATVIAAVAVAGRGRGRSFRGRVRVRKKIGRRKQARYAGFGHGKNGHGHGHGHGSENLHWVYVDDHADGAWLGLGAFGDCGGGTAKGGAIIRAHHDAESPLRRGCGRVERARDQARARRALRSCARDRRGRPGRSPCAVLVRAFDAHEDDARSGAGNRAACGRRARAR